MKRFWEKSFGVNWSVSARLELADGSDVTFANAPIPLNGSDAVQIKCI